MGFPAAHYRKPICLALLVLGVGAASVWAQGGNSAPRNGDWKLDRILLASGKTIEGLILEDDPESDVEFIEVRRPPGKPMNLVIRPIERRTIAHVERITDEERTDLRKQLDKFTHRATIEARRMDDIPLTSRERDGTTYWQYHGDWFWLESTADEVTTRRAAVRIEQVFTAFRQVLPPTRTSQRRLKIMLFGAKTQYANFLGGLGLEIANPAFFAADFNIVAAGSDINPFMAQLAQARHEHQARREHFERELAQLPERLQTLSDQLREQGINESERKLILATEQRAWQDRRQRLLEEITQADRRNAQKFEQVTGEMFARLYHEAFHAYLDNFVYPHHEFDVPRWLNEGLALTFEGGQLEVETLRVDAPNRRVLRELQQDLRSARPMSLKELLAADVDAFLPAHRGGQGQSARLYQYSWGLAYYITFDLSLLGTPALHEFIAPAAREQDPVARFEKLVGQPLDKFEAQWRAAILKMR